METKKKKSKLKRTVDKINADLKKEKKKLKKMLRDMEGFR